MASNDLQSAQRKWQQRISSARAKGLSDSLWRGLYQQDISNIQAGHTPMADAQVVDAIRTAMGKSPIHDPHKDTGPLDIFGNIASDVKDIVTGWPAGVMSLGGQAQDLWTYWTGSQQQQDAIAKQYGLKQGSDIQDVGDLLTSMGNMPLLGAFIPGVHTMGALTTSTGRKSLEEHPVGTLLDVLPLISEAGKVATLGDVGATEAEAGARLGEAGASDAAKSLAEQARSAPSAREAFRQGHAVRGAMRATADTLQKVPILKNRIPSRAVVNQWLLRTQLHPLLRQLSRGEFRLSNKNLRLMSKFVGEDLPQALMQLSDGDRELLWRAMASRGTTGDLSMLSDAEREIVANDPRMQSIMDQVDQFNKAAVSYYNDPNNPVTGGKEQLPEVPLEGTNLSYPYAADSPVATAYRKSTTAEQKLQESQNKLDRLTESRQNYEAALHGKHGKVRRYMEPDETFAAREAGPVTAETVRADAAKIVETFRDLDPAQVFGAGLEASDLTASATRTILNDLRLLGGHDGLFAQWDEAMARGDIKVAQATLAKINRLFSKHASWARTPFGRNIIDHLQELKHANTSMRKRERSLMAHTNRHQNAIAREERQKRIVERRRTLADERHRRFKETQYGNNPQAFDPLIVEKVLKPSATQWAERKYATNQAELAKATERINSSQTFQQFKAALGEGNEHEADLLMQEARNQWTALARGGVDPIYMHNVDPSRLEYLTHARVIPDRKMTPGLLKDTTLNFGSSVHDPLASIVDYKRQMLEEASNREFVKQYVSSWASDRQTEEGKIRQAVSGKDHPAWANDQTFIDREMKREWETFDESGNSWLKQYFPASKTSEMVIPKGVGRALRQMSNNETGIPLKGLWDPTLKVWKFAVLTTPRHFAHIAGGGAVMAAGRDPLFFRNIGAAMKFMHADTGDIMDNIGHVHNLDHDPQWELHAGGTRGRLLAEAVGSPVRAFNRLEEKIAQMYKVSVMLEAEKHGFSREEALIEANKTLVSMGEMLPIERTMIRQIFPFYGFTRHLLRYAFTYPSDYPWRAAIIANLARMEQQDWQSGLPQTMQFLFWLGPTDPATGKRTGIDFRSLDPFRSLYSDFSLAGVTSQLNPILQFGLQEIGIDPLKGSPDLYPNVHYDPSTGSLVADAPSNTLMTLFGDIIPQANTVDAMIGITDQYKHLRMTDPDGFKRLLWSQLGFPFAPETFDIPKTIETSAMKRDQDAQKAIGQAVETGDFSSAKRYDYVPIPSTMRRLFGGARYATPGDIEAMWNRLAQQAASRGLANVSPHALLPHVSTKNMPK